MDHISLNTLRRLAVLLVAALALIASACGTEATVLDGDASSRGAGQVGSEPTPISEQPAPAIATDPEAGSPTPVAASTQAVTQDVTPEPTPPVVQALPGLATQVGSGGAEDDINRVDFTIGETWSTKVEPQAFVSGGDPELDDANWLITDVTIEATTLLSWTLRSGNFVVRDPAGTSYPAEDIFDLVGDDVFAVDLAGREYHDVRIAFKTPDLVGDIAGWDLVVSGGDVIPLVMPLTGSAYDHAYPLPLIDGESSVLELDSFPGCSDGVSFETQVRAARVDIEGPGGFGRFLRVPATERLVLIELDVTGLAETAGGSSTTNCGAVVLWPDFVLNVDGRPAEGFSLDEYPNIEGFASTTLYLGFQISTDSTDIELVGGDDGGTLASWQLSLAPEVGEVGATLVPFAIKPRPGTERPASGPRPETLTTTVVADGGASGEMFFVEFGVRASTATNADVEPFAAGTSELDPEGRTWLIAELDVETTTELSWRLGEESFVLEDPAGRPHGAHAIYDRIGEDQYSVALDGIEYHDLRIAFETDGLVVDPTGWNLLIERGSLIPLTLPLAGPAPERGYPLGLRVGDSAEVGNDGFPGCGTGLLEATVNQIIVEIEGPGHLYQGWVRTTPANRFITIDLAVQNLVARQGSNTLNCGALVLWPEFLLRVDGRDTQAFTYDKPSIDGLATEPVQLNYEIPKETQTISLIGPDGTVIGTWQLRDAGQVLDDFGATQTDQGTVITLDETLLFAFGESTLQQSAFAPLNRVANVVNAESTGQITIVGHTDSIGDDASNETLSLARARAVVEALVEAGVDASRLVASGEGESSPVAPNTDPDGGDNPAGRAENRRVEIYFNSN